jgi:hypothetical protein
MQHTARNYKLSGTLSAIATDKSAMTASFSSSAKVTSAVIANLSVAIADKVADDLIVPDDYVEAVMTLAALQTSVGALIGGLVGVLFGALVGALVGSVGTGSVPHLWNTQIISDLVCNSNR